MVEQSGKDKYMIKNAGDLSLCLGVSSGKESANIVVTSDKDKAIWSL